MRGKILIVDDDLAMCQMLESVLKKNDFSPEYVTSTASAFEKIITGDFDVLLADLNMKDLNGIELCERAVANRPDIPVIIITAFGSMETAIAAIRAGAYDFINKPFDTDILILMLDRAIAHRNLQEKVKSLSRISLENEAFENIIGKSGIMTRLFTTITKAAETDASILITGESGTGKELAAKAIHQGSKRKNNPFIPVNCSAIPETLLESELFGYKKGAFTDAKTDKKGLFFQADKGTLFLDEIGDIPFVLQAKLLRALEENKVRPLGGTVEEDFDVRIVAATNRNVEQSVEEGEFRKDLYYRLDVINIEVPPLRLRGNDIILLAGHFLAYYTAQNDKEISKFTGPVIERFLTYDWPGNVRELKNVIERAVALSSHNQIIVEDLPEKIRNYSDSRDLIIQKSDGELITLNELERRYIVYVLKKVNNNKSLAARILGFDRKTLYNKIEYYKIIS